MKHVFVETNFLIGLLRPFPDPTAVHLFERNNSGDLRLYFPWCSQAEVSRTITDVIKEDLGFTDSMMTFAVQHWLADRDAFHKPEIDKLRELARAARNEAIQTINQRIKDCAARMIRIDPSPAVVDRTLEVFAVKALKPFDEMVLGAVLTKADELHRAGERELYFCELDGDLAAKHPPLERQYQACALTVLRNFDVP